MFLFFGFLSAFVYWFAAVLCGVVDRAESLLLRLVPMLIWHFHVLFVAPTASVASGASPAGGPAAAAASSSSFVRLWICAIVNYVDISHRCRPLVSCSLHILRKASYQYLNLYIFRPCHFGGWEVTAHLTVACVVLAIVSVPAVGRLESH